MGKALKEAGKLPPFSISRKRSPIERRVVGQHAKHLGEVVHAWNSAQGALFMVFAALLGNQTTASGLWHTVQSDKLQRDMVEKAAIGAKHLNKSVRNAVLWTTGCLQKLSAFRNDAAHVQMVFTPTSMGLTGTLVPNTITSRTAALKRTAESPLERNWRKLRGDLIALDNYAMDLYFAILIGTGPPLSYRPRMALIPAGYDRSAKRRKSSKGGSKK